MAKDPAILFYFDNWRGGTMTMTRHLKGAYMDLLDAQFNNGHLSLEEIKTVLGTDFAAWGSLSKKFAVDEAGKYFNERMQAEINKRKLFTDNQKAYSDKQKERVKKRWGKNRGNTVVLPKKGNGNGIGNLNGIQDEGVGEGFFLNEISMDLELTNVEINAVKEFISIACNHKQLSDSEVKDHWKAFKINNFKTHEWYGSHEKLLIHFRHSLKNELNKIYGRSTKSLNGKGAGLSGNAVIRSDKTYKRAPGY